MKLTEQEMEIVDAYLLGNLQGDALIDFEQRLKEDNEFAEDVEELRTIMMAAKRTSLEDKMKLLQKEEAKLDDLGLSNLNGDSETNGVDTSVSKSDSSDSGGAKVRRIPWMRVLSVAASVLVIGVAGLWWNGEQKEQARIDGLYAQHFNPPESEYKVEKSSENMNINELEARAFNLYDSAYLQFKSGELKSSQEAFAKAIPLFHQLHVQTGSQEIYEYLIWSEFGAKQKVDKTLINK